MKLSKNQQWIFIGLILAAFIVSNTVMLLSPQYSQLMKGISQYKTNENEINNIQKNMPSSKAIEEQKKLKKYSLSILNDALPNSEVPENYLMLLKNEILNNGLTGGNISFTKPVEYSIPDVKLPYNPTSDVAQQADKLITGLFEDSSKKSNETNQDELQYTSIQEDKPIKVDVSFQVSGSYQQIKSFVQALENEKNKISINKIVMKSDKDSSSTADLSLTFYGFKDSSMPIYDLWTPLGGTGKSELFSTEGSTRYDINDTNISDFDITLNPVTYDAPSVIVGEHNQPLTDILAENAGIETVELTITERDGRFFYKYKNQNSRSQNYNSGNEFKPVVGDSIIVKVYSKARLSNVDRSGINLIVYKQTSRNINVIPINDDQTSPRVKWTIK